MAETIIGFIIWVIVGIFFIVTGISSFKSKEATGFWANVKMYDVTNVKEYNAVMGKLWISFGIILILLGLPLLGGQNSPWILISMIGVFIEIIVFMIIYEQIITPKFRKK